MLKKIVLPAIFAFSLATTHAFAGSGHSHAGDNHDHGSNIVNINTASAEVMDKKMKFVGAKTAKRIVEYRKTNGKFKSVEELDAVKGVGKRVINANRKILVVE